MRKPAQISLRLKSNFPSNLKLIWVVQSGTQNIPLCNSENQNYKQHCLVPT